MAITEGWSLPRCAIDRIDDQTRKNKRAAFSGRHVAGILCGWLTLSTGEAPAKPLGQIVR
jgi:hypothetical protein